MKNLRNYIYLFFLVIIIILILFYTNAFNIFNNQTKIEKIILNDNNLNLVKGNSYQLSYDLFPETEKNNIVIFESSDTSIVDVNEITGYVNAKNEGNATITIKLQKDSGIFDTCNITVYNENNFVADNSISKLKVLSENITININENQEIKVFNPNNEKITWESDDNLVVNVSENGIITGIKEGITYITITSNSKIIKKIKVTVNEAQPIIKIINNIKNLNINEEITLITQITPEKFSNKKVIWKSSNNDIISVKNGKIKALKEGNAIITASIEDTLVSDSINIEVKKIDEIIPETDINVSTDTINLKKGESMNISAFVLPTNATYQVLSFSTSNKTIATVNNGLVTAKNIGSCDLIITTSYKKITKKLTINVSDIEISSISLNYTNKTLYVGNKLVLIASINPNNATIDKTISWSSSDKNIATVDSNGNVVAKKTGTTTITAKTSNEKKATCNITVIENPVEAFAIALNKDSATLYVNQSLSLTAVITPSNTTDKTISWSSSDKNIATVDSNGNVVAKKTGTATITAKTSNGKKATFSLSVKNNYIKNDTFPYEYEDATSKLKIEKKTYSSKITNKTTTYYLAYLKITDYSRLHTGINNNGNGCNTPIYSLDVQTNSEKIVGQECGKVSVAATNNKAIFAVEGDYALNGSHTGCNKIKGSIRDGNYYYIASNKKDLSKISASGIGYGYYSKQTGIMGPTSNLKSKNALDAIKSKEATDSFCFDTDLLVNGNFASNSYMDSTAHRQSNFIGYKGPGEFYFVVAEGAIYTNADTPGSDGKSYGLTPKDRAQIIKDLGCSYGVQLDGGTSIIVWFNGKILNVQNEVNKEERNWLTDFVYFK